MSDLARDGRDGSDMPDKVERADKVDEVDQVKRTDSVAAIRMEGVSSGAMRDQELVVAQEVNWTVAQGDYWVVGGLQGSGKSDFLMMTAGLMPPIAGAYRLFGEEM